MSTQHDTYEQALIAALALLDALYDDIMTSATTAFDPDADDYDWLTIAHGVTLAIAIISGMLDGYRREHRDGAA